MNTIHVSASRGYDVKIGHGLLPTLGAEAAKLCKGRTACIVSDDSVAALYEKTARASLEAAGFSVFTYVFPMESRANQGRTF